MTKLIARLAALVVLAAAPVAAQDAMTHAGHDAPHLNGEDYALIHHGALELSGAFTRATLPNQPVGGGYVTIVNTGTTDDRLVSASSPAAGHVEIHEMRVENDIMTMRALEDGLVIAAGETVTLAPGGFHLMLMDLTAPIVEGESIAITLTFAQAGPIEIGLVAAGAGARTAPDGSALDDAHAHHAGH